MLLKSCFKSETRPRALLTSGLILGALKKQLNIFTNGIPGDPGHEKLLVNRETCNEKYNMKCYQGMAVLHTCG